jgi:RimJ/RimL family protein N-acetyltransferase
LWTDRAIRLEPLEQRHRQDVEALVADPEVLRYTRIPEPPGDEFARTWIAGYEAGRGDGTREGFAAIAGAGEEFVGLGLAPHLEAADGEVELGYIVAAGARGRGAASEILRLLTAWAFGEGGVLRAYLVIDVENRASERVAERCGYLLEGVMRSIHFKQGRRIDAGLWSRLPSDPDPSAS